MIAPFHEVFDWEPPHLWGVTVYYSPMAVSRTELHRIEQILHSSEAAVARAVARAPGVDFAAWREGDAVRAVSGDGRADPLDRPGDRYPDLRARLGQGLRAYAVHPASVIVSLADGWHLGLSRAPEPPRAFVDPCLGASRLP